jgi:2'-5' RNA ligase
VALVVTGPLAHEINGMRRALGARALQRIAPHCTLVPPVNIREENLEAVLAHVRAAASKSSPIAIDLGPPATFWPRTPVLYLEVGGELASLTELQADLVTGPLAPPGTRREREYVPHLTLDQQIEPGRLAHALNALGDYRATYCFESVSILEQDADHRWWPMADAALGRAMVAGRGSLDLELFIVERPDPLVAAWVDQQWSDYRRTQYGKPVVAFQPYGVVARTGGRVVGFAEGQVQGAVMRLDKLIVSPERRNQGVGSHLLRAVERLALERGCGLVRLVTLAGGAAEGFYGERGYLVSATLPQWSEGRDFVLMQRQLTSPAAPPRL